MAIETNELIDIQTLPPFKKFIMTIGNIPTSYLESMTYAELLMWFCNYLQNTVIPTVNNNAEAVEELQDLYEELKNYVNDYFDNLDVQEEINKKLDQMAYDGSLTALIQNYIDPIYSAYTSDVNNRLDNMETQIGALSTGTPLPATSTSEMTDTDRIYVNTTDGYWYYYNGTTWLQGGEYQAVSLADNTVTYDKLDTNLQANLILADNLVNRVTRTDDKWLNYETGELFNASAYSTSDFIKVEPNTTYYTSQQTALNTFGVRYCEYGSDKTYLNIYHTNTDITNTQFTTSANTYYVRIGMKTVNYNNYAILSKNKLQYISNIKNLLLNGNKMDGYSINGNSIIDKSIKLSSIKEYKILSNNLYNPDNVTTANKIISGETGLPIDFSDYFVTDYQNIEPNTTYAINNVYRISFYDKNYNFIDVITASQQPTTFTTPVNAVYYRFTAQNANASKLKLGKGTTPPTDNFNYTLEGVNIDNNTSNISNILYGANNTINIKLIGDSITYGVGASPDHSWANLLKSSLESKFLCNVVNAGVSGVNSEYLVNNIGTLISDTDNIVICMIGTNNRISQSSFNRLYSDLQTIYSYCKERNIKFIPMCSLPASLTDEERENGTFNVRYKHMDDIENVISAFSNANNLEFIDLYEKVYMYCMTKGISINSLLADGLHPNDTGYYLMFRFISHDLGVDAKLENATW